MQINAYKYGQCRYEMKFHKPMFCNVHYPILSGKRRADEKASRHGHTGKSRRLNIFITMFGWYYACAKCVDALLCRPLSALSVAAQILFDLA